MTNGQRIIVNYLQSRNITDYLLSGTDYVIAQERAYTINLYGDILDANTRTKIAEADIERDLRKLGSKLPEKWTDIER